MSTLKSKNKDRHIAELINPNPHLTGHHTCLEIDLLG
jgi:hypothetical protein